MKVTNSEVITQLKDNEDLYKKMNKSLSRKITNKELEINKIDELYKQKIAIAKNAGEEDYLQNLERNQIRMNEETNLINEKLAANESKLMKAKEAAIKEQELLKGEGNLKITNLKSQLEENYQDQYIKTQEAQRDIQTKTQDDLKEITTISKFQKSDAENNAKFEINAMTSDFNNSIDQEDSMFRKSIEHNIRAHQAEMSRQKDDLKKVMTMDTEKNKRLNQEKNRVNNDQLNFQDKYQKEMLKQREMDFKVRYETIVKEHESILNNLSGQLQNDVQKMVASTTAERKVIEERIDDPFYKIDTLGPKMTEDLKEVTISLPVAEYEKENVFLSTQGRQIKMTLSRKYSDQTVAEDGSRNKSTRSELFSKEFMAKDLLDSGKITSQYVDGVLSFKIKKA